MSQRLPAFDPDGDKDQKIKSKVWIVEVRKRERENFAFGLITEVTRAKAFAQAPPALRGQACGLTRQESKVPSSCPAQNEVLGISPP